MIQAAVGYGRKSFDDPDNRTSSVNDQKLFAKNYAQQHGFDMIAFHADDGITGATMERPGLQAALAAIQDGTCKIIIIEDVDRLSRDQEHLSYMIKLFRLNDVTVHTVAAGKIDDLTLAFKGIIGEQQRMRIAYTTRPGLKGKAARGGATGGKTLGYVREMLGANAEGRPVDRLVVSPPEAALVRRIFLLYADGHSLQQICDILNDEGVHSPRAREKGKYNSGVWNPPTLSGNVQRGEGILNNQLYIGRRIFNRRKWVEIPNDNRGFSRRPRLNPESEWTIRDEPDLRIVDQPLWEKVKVRQLEARAARDAKFKLTGNPLAGAKRPTHFLSGLVSCGVCGDQFVSVGGRWRCKTAHQNKCSNSSIAGKLLEARAVVGLTNHLLTPEIISRFAIHLQRELDEQLRDTHCRRNEIESALIEARTRAAKIIARIEVEEDAPRSLTARLKELEAEEERLAQELGSLPERMIVRLPENYEAVYRTAIAELEQHLATREASASRSAIRTLIETVVVHGGDSRGGRVRRLELHGDLFRMLEFAEAASGGSAASLKRLRPQHFHAEAVSGTSLVAGVGFEPTTFRL